MDLFSAFIVGGLVWITVLPANYTMPLPRKRSPDGATTSFIADIKLQLNAHFSTRKDDRPSQPS